MPPFICSNLAATLVIVSVRAGLILSIVVIIARFFRPLRDRRLSVVIAIIIMGWGGC